MIELKNVSKSYDKENFVVKNLNMKINDGELVVLIGESGCGKTTTMKMINRLIETSEGDILIDNMNVKDISPFELRRRIGYVIQKVGLFPHMTVGQNVELVPKLKSWPKEKRKQRAVELLEMVDLSEKEYYNRFPNELSGGQQQRVGVARALAINPEIILMDEPFSALDPITREQLQNELLNLQEELHKTIVFVTHDMDEALKLGDRIAVMKDGKLLQYDTPEKILKHPTDEYVENFVGKDRLWKSPEMVYAKDIMNNKITKVSINRSTASAIEIMREKKISYLGIVAKQSDKKQKLVGYVTKSELKKAKENEKIKDIFNEEVPSINENSNMVEILSFMSQMNLKQVFVTDNDGYFVGTISESDIIGLISDIAVEQEGGNE